MREETPETPAPLRSGYTTGSCATATSLVAARLLLLGETSERAGIVLPKGRQVTMTLSFCRRVAGEADTAEAGVIKDAGDDPDVTHGALVFARVRLSAGAGVRFAAGEGVGTVTRAGLALAIGEPAINPVPRAMIRDALLAVAADNDAPPPDATVTISIPGGERLAAKTMNARLGIIGGLSILGTTGIVVPYSCSSWI